MESRKTRYTKEVIRESFLALLQEKPVEKITVTQLCAVADINRSTFYSHYLDVYDLLHQLEDTFYQEISQIIRLEEGDALFLNMVKAFVEHRDFCLAMFGKYGDHAFLGKCFSIWEAPLSREKDPILRYQNRFIVGGSASVVVEWIQSGMKESPEKIAQVIQRLTDVVGTTQL